LSLDQFFFNARQTVNAQTLPPLQDIKVEAIDYDQMVKAKEAVRTLFVSHIWGFLSLSFPFLSIQLIKDDPNKDLLVFPEDDFKVQGFPRELRTVRSSLPVL